MIALFSQEEDKAKARASTDWEWGVLASAFAVPPDFVLLDLSLSYTNGCFTLFRIPDAGIAALQFGADLNFQMVSSSCCTLCTIASNDVVCTSAVVCLVRQRPPQRVEID